MDFIMDRFLMRFTADEREINLATGEAEMEFSEWKWATPDEVIDQVKLDYGRVRRSSLSNP